MKIIQTLNSNLHTKIQESMRNQRKQLEQKRWRNREEFLKRVRKTLQKNFVK